MKKTIWLITLALSIIWLPGAPLADKGTSDKINWKSYTSAQSSKTDKRKFFLYFYTERCGYCNLLEKKTFTDKEVIKYINSNYTPIRVNADKDFKVAAKFGIQGVPDLRFLTKEGDNIARWPGYIETKRLLPLLEYIHTDSYENISYTEFLKGQKGKR